MNSEPSSAWTLSTIWGAIRKLWFVVVIAAVLGGGVAFGLSALTKPVYESTATLYFSLSEGGTAADLANGTNYAQSQMLSFAQLATSSKVLRPVVETLGLDVSPQELSRSINVTIPPTTQVLEIDASARSGRQAAAIANAVALSLKDVVRDVAPKQLTGQSPTIAATLVDVAVPPKYQSSPNKSKDAVLGVIVGLIVGIVVALLWTLLDTRVRNEQALKRFTDLPVLGSISKAKTSDKLLVVKDTMGVSSEEFRRVRSALAYAGVDERTRRIVVSSSGPGEGKTVFSCNLALTLADLGSRVILIDADLRRPRVARYFGLEGSIGLTTVLVGESDLDRAKQAWQGGQLDVLTSGTIPPNPAELLASESMKALLDQALERYDYVLLDSPPVLSVADADLLVPEADGVIIVVDARKTHRSALAKALTSLEGAGGRVIGIVLNRVRADAQRFEGYGEYVEKKDRRVSSRRR